MSEPRIWSIKNWGVKLWTYEDLLVPRKQAHCKVGSQGLWVLELGLLTCVPWDMGELRDWGV